MPKLALGGRRDRRNGGAETWAWIKHVGGPIAVDTGNAFLDIAGLVFIILAVAYGLRVIARAFRDPPPPKNPS